jgi:hypothetical protein
MGKVKHDRGRARLHNYRTRYNQDDMEDAIKAVKDGMSVKLAAARFQVPRTTLGDRAKGRTKAALGRPTQLTEEEERILAERAVLLGTWGFPLNFRDFRELVKSYLDVAGRTTVFKDNFPTKKFVIGFLARHKELSFRKANNIKRSRAMVSREEVEKFFEHFSKTVEGVPASNIWNFDETNFKDDPGSEKALFRKGTKYAERVMNSTKSAVTVMFCGSAKGATMPPYIVYKAMNLYDSWTRGGPKGTRFNTSKSGWFDSCIFRDWFKNLALPILKRQVGKKVIVCDNLASHISESVIALCRENDIEFVCLPPNATDKLQPLDVGLFAPMKRIWREVLLDFKKSNPTEASIPKTIFPGLIKSMVDRLKPEQLLPNAFKKCGLCPLDPAKAVERIPHVLSSNSIAQDVDASLLKKLETERFGTGDKKKPRGKKLSVPAGRSYTSREDDHSDSSNYSGEEDEDDQNDEDEDGDVDEEMDEEVEVEEGQEASDEELPDIDVLGGNSSTSLQSSSIKKFMPGKYVIAKYDNEWYVAQVVENQEEVQLGYTRLHYMTKKGRNHFTWGTATKKEDILNTLHEDILLEIPPPVPVTSRFLGVSDKHAIEAERLLSVVVFIFKISNFSNLKLSQICLNLLFRTFKENTFSTVIAAIVFLGEIPHKKLQYSHFSMSFYFK